MNNSPQMLQFSKLYNHTICRIYKPQTSIIYRERHCTLAVCLSVFANTPSCPPFFFIEEELQHRHLGFVTSQTRILFEIYLLKPNRIEFRGGQVRGGEGGRGGTGAMRRAVHINKVGFTDVKKLLFKKFI